MSREGFICVVVALGCHALLLFGVHLGKGARPLPVAQPEVEVSLVEAAPAAPAQTSPEVAPPPEEPLVEPKPEEIPEPTPKPRPPEPPRVSVPRVVRPIAPAPRVGTAGGAGTTAVSAGAGLGNTKPRYRSNPRPDYPAEARRLRQKGRVLLDVEVSAEGRALSVEIKRSSGVPSLDAAALAAVRRWTFEPARTAGVAVSARVEVPVQFDLAR
ncbi:MAG: energy transducer TonB [Chthoniobacter sp.]|nr:energy transducer TonB [Chthoniobacter sp.]